MTTAAEAGADRAGVVIPVRSFRDAKRRLGSVLTDDEREEAAERRERAEDARKRSAPTPRRQR